MTDVSFLYIIIIRNETAGICIIYDSRNKNMQNTIRLIIAYLTENTMYSVDMY